MRALNSEEVKTSMTVDETHSLRSHDVEDVGNTVASSSVLNTSE